MTERSHTVFNKIPIPSILLPLFKSNSVMIGIARAQISFPSIFNKANFGNLETALKEEKIRNISRLITIEI